MGPYGDNNTLENHMLEITLSPEARERLKALLEVDDDYEEAFIRIREVKVGSG